tara:strand:+ start:4740 stop:5057 length:318 start_codon:yes stop_codon:yes gene_type:complete
MRIETPEAPEAPEAAEKKKMAEPKSIKVPATLSDLLSSKKFIVTLVGIGVILLQSFGFNVTDDQRDTIIQLIMVYVGAQGLSDVTKPIADSIRSKAEKAAPEKPA